MRSAFPASETLFIVAAGNFWMSQLNLNISPGQVVSSRLVKPCAVTVNKRSK
jgi:hypothetical protein